MDKLKAWHIQVPAADRSFLDPLQYSVRAAVLFSFISDVSTQAPHPTGLEWNESIISDRPGAGSLDPEMSSKLDENWDLMWEGLTSEVGDSVPYASDLPRILDLRKSLVEGVIAGRPDRVEAALAAGAGAHALIPVRHPNWLPGTPEHFVAVPLGVAAVMLKQRFDDAAKSAGVSDDSAVRVQSAAYSRIASRLLIDAAGRPTVKIGTPADGGGLSMSYFTLGIKGYESNNKIPTTPDKVLGRLALVNYVENINPKLGVALANVSPDIYANHRLLPQDALDHRVGDALPDRHAVVSVAHFNHIERAAPLKMGQSGYVSPELLSRSLPLVEPSSTPVKPNSRPFRR